MPRRAAQPKQEVFWDCKGNEKLELFLSCPADEVLYGGAAGGAKSEGILISALGSPEAGFFNNPNWRVLILRRTMPELERSLILRSHQLFYGRAKYDGVKHRWTSACGAIIQFGHMEAEGDMHKYQSAEYCLLEFDELTHFTERQYLYMFSRLRSPDPRIRSRVRCASNPGGIGHAWVKKRFLGEEDNKKQPGVIYESELTLPNGVLTKWSQCFIPATVYDNKVLMNNDPLYVRRLMELPEVERRALLEGDWDIFSGQFFPEWSDAHICEDFDFPEDWPVWISMDWGVATRCAVLFFTQDPDSKVTFCFDEIYCTLKNADTVAGMIKDRLGKRIGNLLGRYADRRIMVKDDETQIDTKAKFSMHGLHFQLAGSERVEGWHRVRELLQKTETVEMNFRVFRRCKNFIRTLPECIFDMRSMKEGNDSNHSVEDMYPRGETHIADALRYFAMMRRHSEIPSGEYTSVPYSSVTGYIGIQNGGEDNVPLRNKIKRLPGLERGKTYFIDRPREKLF